MALSLIDKQDNSFNIILQYFILGVTVAKTGLELNSKLKWLDEKKLII